MSQVPVVRPLTKQQRAVLVTLERCASVGVTPSLRDVGRRLGIHFTRVQQHLDALHEKGWLEAPTTGGVRCTRFHKETPLYKT